MPKFEDNKVSHFRHLTGRFGQLADVFIFADLVSLERSGAVRDIRFLIGLCSIADINAE
jgi:hypothetical protein